MKCLLQNKAGYGLSSFLTHGLETSFPYARKPGEKGHAWSRNYLQTQYQQSANPSTDSSFRSWNPEMTAGRFCRSESLASVSCRLPCMSAYSCQSRWPGSVQIKAACFRNEFTIYNFTSTGMDKETRRATDVPITE